MKKEYKTHGKARAFYKSTAWKKMRQQILERDNYECQWCKAEGRVTDKNKATLEVDHIQELEAYPELGLELTNLRTLCRDCHNKRHKRFNYAPQPQRNKWIDDEIW